MNIGLLQEAWNCSLLEKKRNYHRDAINKNYRKPQNETISLNGAIINEN